MPLEQTLFFWYGILCFIFLFSMTILLPVYLIISRYTYFEKQYQEYVRELEINNRTSSFEGKLFILSKSDFLEEHKFI